MCICELLTQGVPFQAAQLNVSNVDLGSLFLSFLQFYSEPSHFDVTRHAIDVVVPSGFAQKHTVQVRTPISPAFCLLSVVYFRCICRCQDSFWVFVLLGDAADFFCFFQHALGS